MDKKLELGKRYTWEEVSGAYPGMWVRMSNCNLSAGGDIDNGILVGVYTDEESIEVELKMWDEESKDELQRTTYDMNIGVIDCLNAVMEVQYNGQSLTVK